MGKTRLEAFSDAVIAIILTIMVLEMKVPHGDSLESLRPVVPVFLSYVLSFVFIGIYWNNHHHLLHATTHINGTIMWANLHLLFWLSLIPFTTRWVGQTHFGPVPTATYGTVFLLSAIAWIILQSRIVKRDGRDSILAAALGSDAKGKLSLAMYTGGVGMSFVSAWISVALYATVALMWLVPDRRIEAVVEGVHRS